LFGGHAVNFDRPCIVTAVDLRVTVSVSKTPDRSLVIRQIEAGQKMTQYSSPLSHFSAQTKEGDSVLSCIIGAAKAMFHIYEKSEGLDIIYRMPRRTFGLVNQAPFVVSVVHALSHLFQLDMTDSEVFDLSCSVLAELGEDSIGEDVAAAVYGGTVFFSSANETTIEPLQIEHLPIVVGFSGQLHESHHFAQLVAARHQTLSQVVTKIFDTSEEVTTNAKDVLTKMDWEGVAGLMVLDQSLLAGLGVNTLELSQPMFAAYEAGALAAKISGGGTGDCMFALIDEKQRSEVTHAILEAGAEVVDVRLQVPGVTLE